MGGKLERGTAETLVGALGKHGHSNLIPRTRDTLATANDQTWQPAHIVAAGAARMVAQGIVDTIREPLLVLDRGLRLVAASRAFCTTFKLDIDDILGQPVYELGHGEWNIPHLRLLLGQIIPEQGAMENYEVEHDFRSLGRRTMLLNAREVYYEGASPANIFLSIEDVTGKRRLERENAELLRLKDTLLDEIYHRVGNSLQIIRIISMKARKVTSDEARRHLEDTRDRVISVAAVQKYLHVSTIGGSVALIPYLSNLCKALSGSMIGDDQTVSIEMRGEEANVGRAKAESLGLIVAELVINSLKHAFGDVTTGGLIVVTFGAVDTEWTLSVCDNGGGKQKHGIVAEGGLGTGIVAALARQLNALVVTKSGPEGTSVSIAHYATKAV
jgi:two-component sensor histidine kinase